MEKKQTQKGETHLTRRKEKIESQLKIAQLGRSLGAALLLIGMLLMSGRSIYLSIINEDPLTGFLGPIIVILGLIIGIMSNVFTNQLSNKKRNTEKEIDITDQP